MLVVALAAIGLLVVLLIQRWMSPDTEMNGKHRA